MPNDAWITDDPPTHGYYLATWIRADKLVVSELWFNPDANFKWWSTRAYLRDRNNQRPVDDAINQGVLAWMPMPEPYQSE